MAQVVDMKRFASLALALLIAVAVVGPVCLMAASSAMAMTMPSSASSLCDSDPATMCPYERPDANFAGANVLPYAASMALQPVFGSDVPTELGQALAPVVSLSQAPVSHLTPLRI